MPVWCHLQTRAPLTTSKPWSSTSAPLTPLDSVVPRSNTAVSFNLLLIWAQIQGRAIPWKPSSPGFLTSFHISFAKILFKAGWNASTTGPLSKLSRGKSMHVWQEGVCKMQDEAETWSLPLLLASPSPSDKRASHSRYTLPRGIGPD